jgi:hypothetical protein
MIFLELYNAITPSVRNFLGIMSSASDVRLYLSQLDHQILSRTIANILLMVQGSRYDACLDAPMIPQTPLTSSTKVIVQGWINECNGQHIYCARQGISYPKRLLDLQPQELSNRICLVEHPGVDARYTALTHC